MLIYCCILNGVKSLFLITLNHYTTGKSTFPLPNLPSSLSDSQTFLVFFFSFLPWFRCPLTSTSGWHQLILWTTCSQRSDLRRATNTQQLRYGDRTFAAAGPRLWNSLPVQLRNPDITYRLFRWELKGNLFREALTWRSVTSDMRHLRKILTYLPAQ